MGACEPTSVLCRDPTVPTQARCVTRDISKRASRRAAAVHVAAGVGTWRRRWAARLRCAGCDHVLASRALVRSFACRMRIEFAEWLGGPWLLGLLAGKLGFLCSYRMTCICHLLGTGDWRRLGAGERPTRPTTTDHASTADSACGQPLRRLCSGNKPTTSRLVTD